MWELGYITHRSAKWRNYLVGQFGSVLRTQNFLHPKPSAHLKEAGGKRGHGGVQVPTRRVSEGWKQPGVLLSGTSHDFSCPCTWGDGKRVNSTVKCKDNGPIMINASKSWPSPGSREFHTEYLCLPPSSVSSPLPSAGLCC